MNPTKTSALMCSCGQLYPDNEFGKELAERCCLCKNDNCSGLSQYVRTRTLCKKCAAQRELKEAEENLKWAEERLHKAQIKKNGII